ncbi:hypothetical protein COU93_03900 [Candidatus Shapirobacteria bacterium CG10_big_fil_rev_8_21_14_0_10_36_6]|uniref:Uncharacterized protein n=1 Tax=Candidatus Shapirobacteria bacterium CG10_big_fil_rev_8_21_14_0_10_36_6 TaxID=1974886 RepID=A0A2M8L0S4_9BACT|nr:MAG: hypothetical protein COU93_03900 [Candidatus Shapirobacteria bacterium CG10_big_fil_rev_8_21_14_0_10_36_6]
MAYKPGWTVYVEHFDCAFAKIRKKPVLTVVLEEDMSRKEASQKALSSISGRCPNLNELCGGSENTFRVVSTIPNNNIF